MVEMRSSEVVLSLAAQLASWRAVLVLVLSWATCKPGQRWDLHQYSIFLSNCLSRSQQPVWDSAGAAAATESRTVGKGRRKRRYADLDGPGANREPELGPRGPTLKKQVMKEFDRLDLSPVSQLTDSSWDRPFEDCPLQKWGESLDLHSVSFVSKKRIKKSLDLLTDDLEAMDPAGSPSSTRKVADTARPSSSSSSAAPDSGWRSFFCLGNGK